MLMLTPTSRPLLMPPASQYRALFGKYAFFNRVQSACVDDALYTDTNLVVSGKAPLKASVHMPGACVSPPARQPIPVACVA